MTKCCYSVVGVLIWKDDRLLMFERNTPPKGIACPAGHIDDHGSSRDAAIAEVREEVGLKVANVRLLMTPLYLPYQCRRQNEQEEGGHLWFLYEAQVHDYTIQASPREAKHPYWYNHQQLSYLAQTDQLEPAWKTILETLEILPKEWHI